jgi:agmatinase
MPMRDAPLPRMAGDLTFMRSRRASVESLHADNLAILGAPIEDNIGRKAGTRFAPTAIRETSVYFGWHANPQFSHPVDIDKRSAIDTSAMHGRLVDVGDIPLEGLEAQSAVFAIRSLTRRIAEQNASTIVLGGDDSIVEPAIDGAIDKGSVGFIQIGGRLPGHSSLFERASGAEPVGHDAPPLARLLSDGRVEARNVMVMVSPSRPGIEFVRDFQQAGGVLLNAAAVAEARAEDITKNACTLARSTRSLHVQFDASAFRPSLHGMSERPAFGGLTLPDVQKVLGAIGQAPVSSLMVTGLNPTLSGLSVVKTGLRLTVTALLSYIYGRLGLTTIQAE